MHHPNRTMTRTITRHGALLCAAALAAATLSACSDEGGDDAPTLSGGIPGEGCETDAAIGCQREGDDGFYIRVTCSSGSWTLLETCPAGTYCLESFDQDGAVSATGCIEDDEKGAKGDVDASGGGGGGGPTSAVGLGATCESNADCKEGFSCYEFDSDGSKACSVTCGSHNDCPTGTRCNPVQGTLLCTLPDYCDPCESDDTCGPDAPICLKLDAGQPGFCTRSCIIGDTKCVPGSSCEPFGGDVDKFACQPDYGSCDGGGEHCAPCKVATDCSPGTECFQASPDDERFCAQICDPSSPEKGCPVGFKCAAYGQKGYCYREIDVPNEDGELEPQLFPICGKGDKAFCDACTYDYECASNRCATKEGKSFCVTPTPCSKETELQDCPYGQKATFCVPSSKGNICAPPISSGCQGFQGCLLHPCGQNEVCDKGVCKPK